MGLHAFWRVLRVHASTVHRSSVFRFLRPPCAPRSTTSLVIVFNCLNVARRSVSYCLPAFGAGTGGSFSDPLCDAASAMFAVKLLALAANFFLAFLQYCHMLRLFTHCTCVSVLVLDSRHLPLTFAIHLLPRFRSSPMQVPYEHTKSVLTCFAAVTATMRDCCFAAAANLKSLCGSRVVMCGVALQSSRMAP